MLFRSVFVQQDGVWRLAGINYGVDGPFNTGPTGAGFPAALFDVGGLYHQISAGVWQPIPDLPTPQPSSFYSTRIKARREWIDSVLATRTAITPTILGAATVTGPYVADTAPSIDASTKTITIAIGSANRFFQLQSTTALTIVNTRLVGSNLVIQYQ